MPSEYDRLIDSLFTKAEASGVPLSGTFELTSRCSLDCKMCYIHRKENDREAMRCEKPTEWWLELAKTAKDAGMLLLLLTGGEPLVRRDFEEIYLACRSVGLLVSVNTNATLIDEKKVRFFKENPPHRLNITLYGASEETYASLCGDGKAYGRVIKAIRALKEAGVRLKLNYTLTPYNAQDKEKIFEFANEEGIELQAVSYMYPPVRAQGAPDIERLSAKDAAAAQFGWQRKRLGDDKFRKLLEFKVKSPIVTTAQEGCGERINCRAGSTTFWVTWDGEMTPCGMMNEPKERIEDFSAAWEKIRARRKNIIMPVECARCEWRRICDLCAAVSYAETGRFDGKPEYACKKAHEYGKLCQEFLDPGEKT